MYHQVSMCEIDRARDLAQQTQPLVDAALVLVAIGSHRLALDELHHQERPSLPGHAAIQQRNDQRVNQPRQDLPLLAKTQRRLRAGHPVANELQSNLLLEWRALPLSRIDLSHAALGDQPYEAVSA